MVLRFLFKYWDVALLGMLLLAVIGYRHLADYRLDKLNEERLARVVAEKSLQAQTESSAATAAAIQLDMEEAHERNDFETDALLGIAAARHSGDGLLAPVLRDTARRLRDRQSARDKMHGGGAAGPHGMPRAKALPKP
ncbi:MAG: hypothetical protein PSY14_06680 [bacterium]|nr:hypothetical protein [bacterium]